jgi:hypothetical protein
MPGFWKTSSPVFSVPRLPPSSRATLLSIDLLRGQTWSEQNNIIKLNKKNYKLKKYIKLIRAVQYNFVTREKRLSRAAFRGWFEKGYFSI